LLQANAKSLAKHEIKWTGIHLRFEHPAERCCTGSSGDLWREADAATLGEHEPVASRQ